MALQLYQSPLSLSSSSSPSSSSSSSFQTQSLPFTSHHYHHLPQLRHKGRTSAGVVFVEKEDTELRFSPPLKEQQDEEEEEEEEYDDSDPDPQDVEYVNQIKRVKLYVSLYVITCSC